MTRNPIKFLDAYEKQDRLNFFGREAEINSLYDKVIGARLSLLYGLSGTGKTSLIRCGLANKFSDLEWFELYLRRGTNIIHSFMDTISESTNSLTRRDSPVEAVRKLYRDNFKTIYLIFDQLEELFISGDEDERDSFIQMLSELLLADLNIKIIISMREEYIAYLDMFEEKIPSIYNNRFRLERMSISKVKNVIKNIARAAAIQFENEDDNVSQIIQNVSDKGGILELPYLQVYLYKLYNQAIVGTNDGKKVFDRNLINRSGGLKDIIGDFLDEQVQLVSQRVGSKDLVWKILQALTTVEGTKKTLSIDEFARKLNTV